MADLEQLTDMVDEVATQTGERYEQLVRAHDALRDALAETDGGTPTAGR